MEFNWKGINYRLNVKNFLEIEELRDEIIKVAGDYRDGYLDTKGSIDAALEKFDDWIYNGEGIEQILNEDLRLKAVYDNREAYDIYEFIRDMI